MRADMFSSSHSNRAFENELAYIALIFKSAWLAYIAPIFKSDFVFQTLLRKRIQIRNNKFELPPNIHAELSKLAFYNMAVELIMLRV